MVSGQVAGIIGNAELTGARRLIEVFQRPSDLRAGRRDESALNARHIGNHRRQGELWIEISEKAAGAPFIRLSVVGRTQHSADQRQNAGGTGGPLARRAGGPTNNARDGVSSAKLLLRSPT